ncbi:MAG: 2-oxo acid dehydrogenase subunit E2 [Bacillota bacterium]
MDVIGSYEVRSWPKSRRAHLDTLDQARRKHHIPVLFEVDVTRAREMIAGLKDRAGETPSFTGWIVKCFAQAVSEHKAIHAMRRGSGKLVVFDDVDAALAVERFVAAGGPVESLPMPYVIRKANEKTFGEIHREIRSAQSRPVDCGLVYLGAGPSDRLMNMFFSLPKGLRNLLAWRRLRRNPFLVKRLMGTVMVTAVGMFAGTGGSAWVIPAGIHPLILAVGGIARKPTLVADSVRAGEFLSLTVLFDHEVIDGGPASRCLARFRQLLESGFGLDGWVPQTSPTGKAASPAGETRQ